MGLLGQYIDMLPETGRDRLIEAQEWCVADVLGPAGSRCLVGHAEDWRPFAAEPGWWRRWMDGEAGGADSPVAAAGDVETACSPELFAFRRSRPDDLKTYRSRIGRWGLSSEHRIGSRFDRLCARRGAGAAVRLVKARAARAFRPSLEARPGVPVVTG